MANLGLASTVIFSFTFYPVLRRLAVAISASFGPAWRTLVVLPLTAAVVAAAPWSLTPTRC